MEAPILAATPNVASWNLILSPLSQASAFRAIQLRRTQRTFMAASMRSSRVQRPEFGTFRTVSTYGRTIGANERGDLSERFSQTDMLNSIMADCRPNSVRALTCARRVA